MAPEKWIEIQQKARKAVPPWLVSGRRTCGFLTQRMDRLCEVAGEETEKEEDLHHVWSMVKRSDFLKTIRQ